MPPQIKNYVPALDALHLNLTTDLTPDKSFELSSHGAIDFQTINRYTALDTYYSDGYELRRIKRRDLHYHLNYAVVINEIELAVIKLDRRISFTNQQHIIPFHLNNRALYTVNWIPLVTNFLAAWELKVADYTRVDIALDTNEDAIKYFYKLQDSPKFVMTQGRKLMDDVATRGKRRAGGAREDSLYIGSAKSARQTIIYGKSEQVAATGKEYITEYHAANGLDITKNITRIELSASNDIFTKYTSLYINEDGEPLSKYKHKRQPLEEISDSTFTARTDIITAQLDYTRMRDANYLVSLFAEFTNLDFRHNDNANISRCTRYAFIDFNKYPAEEIMKTTNTKDSKHNDFRAQKQSIESQLVLFKETGNPLLLEAVATYATAYNLRPHLSQLIRLYRLDKYVANCFPAGYFEDLSLEHTIYLPVGAPSAAPAESTELASLGWD